MSRTLEVSQDGAVAIWTLHRPDRRNALNTDLIAALRDALAQAIASPGVRCAVLTGTGTHFSAGGDFSSDASADQGLLAQHDARRNFADLLLDMDRSTLPIVGAINGDAMGGACGLAAACHLLVVDERARFITPELKVGLYPMMITPVLARCLPRKVLAEMILAGRKLTAQDALSLGFANKVAPSGTALDLALVLARIVAARSSAIVALGMRASSSVADLPLAAALEAMHSQLTINLLTDDAAEGISAFLGRREPDWKGR